MLSNSCLLQVEDAEKAAALGINGKEYFWDFTADIALARGDDQVQPHSAPLTWHNSALADSELNYVSQGLAPGAYIPGGSISMHG